MLGFIFFLWKCAVEHFIVNHDDSNLYDGCNSEFIPFQFALSNLCSKDGFIYFNCDVTTFISVQNYLNPFGCT